MLDPNTARLLILLDRPGSANDLLPTDRQALEATLAADPELAAFARHHQRTETALTQAMHNVPVPDAVRSRTLETLLETRARLVWRQRAWVMSGLTALVVTGLLTWSVSHQLRPRFDSQTLAIVNEQAIEAPQREVEQWLVNSGYPVPLTGEWDYGRYLTHGFETIQGVRVPVVTFIMQSPGQRTDIAKVYVISEGKFHLDQVKDAQSSLTMATILRDPTRPGYAWVVIHTSPNLAPFFRAPRDFTRVG
ncbi:MAG: anti-sigma factor family protein [Fimbriiglobus sp.]